MKFPSHKAGLYLTHNDHKGIYLTVKEFLAGPPGWDIDEDDWVSPEERQKAIETNEMWELLWYPDTPVAFCRYRASTLEALMAEIERTCKFEEAAKHVIEQHGNVFKKLAESDVPESS